MGTIKDFLKPGNPPPEDVARLVQAGFRLFDQKKEDWRKTFTRLFTEYQTARNKISNVPLVYSKMKKPSEIDRMLEQQNCRIDPGAVFVYVDEEKKIAAAASAVWHKEFFSGRLEDEYVDWTYKVWPLDLDAYSRYYYGNVDDILLMLEDMYAE